MTTKELKALRMCLKSGEYNGTHVMQAWCAIDELIEMREWRDKAFDAHPNIDLDIDDLDT